MLSARTSFVALTTEFALQTRRVCRSRAFEAGFRKPNARNGTRPEPRLRTILFVFKNRHSLDLRTGWKISSFRKLEIDINKICFTASSVEKQMHTHAVTIRGVRFGTAVSGSAERKTENYVPEMRAYSLSKSARLK